MAIIRLDDEQDRVINVQDGASMIEPCEQLGIPFGCRVGECKVCKIKILSGMENLSSRTEKENMLPDDVRLACITQILKGEVKIERV